MKKIAVLLFLASLSASTYSAIIKQVSMADDALGLNILFDQTSCLSSNGIGACFQNKTDADLNTQNVCIATKISYPNLDPKNGLLSLMNLAPDHYINISWSPDTLKKDYATIEFTLVSCPAEANGYKSVNLQGCRFNTKVTSQDLVVSIYKDNNQLNCLPRTE